MDIYTTYENEGFVLDSITGKGISGLRVEAQYELETGATVVLGQDTSGEDGGFTISLERTAVENATSPDRLPLAASLKVFDDTDPVTLTEASDWELPQAITSSRLHVKLDFEVQVDGVVADASTGPINGALVRLVSRSVTSSGIVDTEEMETTANADGRYRLRHAFDGGRPLSILVRAYDQSNDLLVESEEFCRPEAKFTVNLTVGEKNWRGPSELERLDQSLAREVGASGASLATMSDAEARTMACVVKADGDRVSLLATSEALAAATSVPREAFYGMARSGLPADMDVLADVPATTRLAALQGAIDRGTIRLAPGGIGQRHHASAIVGLADARHDGHFTAGADGGEGCPQQRQPAHQHGGTTPSFPHPLHRPRR